jgi:anion-transporting  ArsA/GET3 family ATPase
VANLKKLLRKKCEEVETIENSSAANISLQKEVEEYKAKMSTLERVLQ